MERKKERPWNLRPFTIYTETPIRQRFAQMISKTRSKVQFGLTIYRGSTWRIRPDHNSKELELDRNVKWYIFCSNFSVGIFFTITHDALFTSEIFRWDEVKLSYYLHCDRNFQNLCEMVNNLNFAGVSPWQIMPLNNINVSVKYPFHKTANKRGEVLIQRGIDPFASFAC